MFKILSQNVFLFCRSKVTQVDFFLVVVQDVFKLDIELEINQNQFVYSQLLIVQLFPETQKWPAKFFDLRSFAFQFQSLLVLKKPEGVEMRISGIHTIVLVELFQVSLKGL